MNEDRQNDNYIVKEDPALIRVLIAQHMRPRFTKFMIGITIYYLLSEWVPNFLSVRFPADLMNIYAGELPPELFAQLPSVPFVAVVYGALIGGALELGRCYYLMAFLRNGTTQYGMLVEGMSVFFKATVIGILRGVLIGAGFACFVIPGVVFAYTYSQAMYLLADDTSKGPIRCMKESRLLMNGNKVYLFRLDFTYILLIVIGLMPSYLIQFTGLVTAGSYSSMFFYLAFRLIAYMSFGNWLMGRVTFYELLTSRGFANFKYSGEMIFRNAGNNKDKIN